MPRVIHFEINADDPDRAIQFYSSVFNWRIEKWDGTEEYWLITTGEENEPGINGGLMKRMDPSASTINTIGVPSLEHETALRQRGFFVHEVPGSPSSGARGCKTLTLTFAPG